MTNNNPPPGSSSQAQTGSSSESRTSSSCQTMPERIWIDPSDADDWITYSDKWREETTEYIRADLATPQPARLTDDEMEGLKLPTGGMQPACSRTKAAKEGWNDCINHLRERGII